MGKRRLRLARREVKGEVRVGREGFVDCASREVKRDDRGEARARCDDCRGIVLRDGARSTSAVLLTCNGLGLD